MKPPGSGEKALLRVRHETRLVYDEAVVEAHTEVRKLPTDTGLQRVITAHLEIEPHASPRTYVDYYGTRVAQFNLLEPHQALTLRADSVVETTGAVACGPEAAADPRPWPERWAEFLHWSPCVPALPDYAQIRHKVSIGSPDAFLDALNELAAIFHERFRYDPDATDVQSDPRVLFAKGGGVCQDFSHAMIGVLRGSGVPARYASGYVYDPGRGDASRAPAVRGAAASHAWVQAWHPELGWVGVDPTNRKLVDWQYVRVGVGRDYRDVQPLRGVFVGHPHQRLSVSVEVSRLA